MRLFIGLVLSLVISCDVEEVDCVGFPRMVEEVPLTSCFRQGAICDGKAEPYGGCYYECSYYEYLEGDCTYFICRGDKGVLEEEYFEYDSCGGE